MIVGQDFAHLRFNDILTIFSKCMAMNKDRVL